MWPPACSQRGRLCTCTVQTTPGTTVVHHITSTQKTQLALMGKRLSTSSLILLAFSLLTTHGPSTYFVPGTLSSWKHKAKSSGASLCQPQEGFLGRKPNLLAILCSSGVYGLLFAAWRQLYPARGQDILGLLIHSYTPTFNFEK